MSLSNVQRLLEVNRKLLITALPSFEKSLAKCQMIRLSNELTFEEEESFEALLFSARLLESISQTELVMDSLLKGTNLQSIARGVSAVQPASFPASK